MGKIYYVYIMASPSKSTYIGVTSNLERRVWEDKQKISMKAHARKFKEVLLVHIEDFPDPWSAIAREKELKDWNRAKKLALIEARNVHWLDLSVDW